ncbi:MAG TPA: GNAT family N-acetyltransferase [Bacteroidota bacterium]|nr:GNAT family N-acetyltransferase [Bacteroidota bacterium]
MINDDISALEIRRIRSDELSVIRNYAPPDWNLDLEELYRRHYHTEYFLPLAAVVGDEIAGTGIAIINNATAWLGAIIVRDEYRNRGIGRAITEHLIEAGRRCGVESFLLTASALGRPIYEKIGFQKDIDYLFFKMDASCNVGAVNERIQPITVADADAVFAMDRAITGESRAELLSQFLEGGFKYEGRGLEGYFLPAYGKGLIVARTEIAGIELLKFRLSRDTSSICIPETNTAGIKVLTSLGFREYQRSPRMFLQKNVLWDPQKIYSRATGYSG